MTVLFIITGVVLSANVFSSYGQNLPCNLNFGVNLTDGVDFQNGSISKDGIVYNKKNIVINEYGVKVGCICNIQNCVRKCCPIGEFMFNKTCVPTNTEFVLPNATGSPLDTYHVVFGHNCPNNETKVLLDPEYLNRLGEFVLEKDGKLYLPPSDEFYSQINYCVDYIKDVKNVKAIICEVEKSADLKTNAIGMIISTPFLLATFIAYAFLPQRNLYAKSLMFYVFSLFWAFVLLIYGQLNTTPLDNTTCILIGSICYFFFMVSFLFMNVMSIDIWWTFGSFRGASHSRRLGENKRFLLYCLYALGVPLLLVIIVITLTITLGPDSGLWYNPQMGYGQCWFARGFPTLLYFYAPITIIIVTNITLFGIIAVKIKKIQNDAAVLKSKFNKKHHEKEKRRFNLYLKLSLAMGINWSLEIISWALSWQFPKIPKEVWYLTDFCNAIYGVFIFFIFVFKKKIWTQLKTRSQKIMGHLDMNESVTVMEALPNRKITSNKEHSSSSTSESTVTDQHL